MALVLQPDGCGRPQASVASESVAASEGRERALATAGSVAGDAPRGHASALVTPCLLPEPEGPCLKM